MEQRIFKPRKGSVVDVISQSTKAVCAAMERELTVPKEKMSSTIRKLKASGYQIIGTSHGNTRMKKIWFIKQGGFGL